MSDIDANVVYFQSTSIFPSWASRVRSPSPAFRSKHLQPLDITRFQTNSNDIPAGRPIWRFHSFQRDVNKTRFHVVKGEQLLSLGIAGKPGEDTLFQKAPCQRGRRRGYAPAPRHSSLRSSSRRRPVRIDWRRKLAHLRESHRSESSVRRGSQW